MGIGQVFLTGAIGLITGAIGSLIAPWVKWGIEKKRMRREARIKVIKELKTLAAEREFDRVKIVNSPNYLTVKEHLSLITIEELERPLNELIVNLGKPAIDFEKKNFLLDLSNLEKEWKLV
jgi:hypothetical protein